MTTRAMRTRPVVTLRDVAQAAGVHPATASRALDPTKRHLVTSVTRTKVQTAARRLGYEPDVVARSLRSGQTATVGVIASDLSNPFVAAVLGAITDALASRDYLPLMIETRDDAARLEQSLSTLLGRRVDAIIATAARRGSEDALLTARRRVPVVLALRHLPGSGLPAVVGDEVHGARLAAEHLLGLGHRRLAQLRGPGDVQTFVDREASFAATVQAAGAELVPSPGRAHLPSHAEGRRLMAELLAAGPPPGAIFAHNDSIAIGAIEVLVEAGLRVPDDVSIVGYNDQPFAANVAPPLTTVRYPAAEVGRLAAESALALVLDPTRPTSHVTVPTELVVRASTAQVPA